MTQVAPTVTDSLKSATGHVAEAVKAGASKVSGAYAATNKFVVANDGFRGAASAFWKQKPVAAFALGTVATIGAVHLVSKAFMGDKTRGVLNQRAEAQEMQR